MYGSSLSIVIRNPLASRRAPMEAAASPLPREETTPPVTKMYFGFTVFSGRISSSPPHGGPRGCPRPPSRTPHRRRGSSRRSAGHAAVPGAPPPPASSEEGLQGGPG